MDRHRVSGRRPFQETLQSPLHGRKRAGHLHRRKSAGPGDLPSQSLLFPIGKGLLLFLALGLLFACSDGASNEKMASLEARLQKLEARATQLEGQVNQIAPLKDRIGRLELSVAKLDKLATTKTVVREKKVEPKTVYHVVQPGEILSRIADKYGMTLNDLCRLNNITPKAVIHPGQRLMVSARE